MPEPKEHLPLTVRLAAKRLRDEVGRDGLEEEGLYVALRRSNTSAWRPRHGRRPFTPPSLGSNAGMGAVHPEGMEAVLGVDAEERLSLTADNVVLIATSSMYHLANRGGVPGMLVVVCTLQDADAGGWQPPQHIVAVGEDAAGGTSGSVAQ